MDHGGGAGTAREPAGRHARPRRSWLSAGGRGRENTRSGGSQDKDSEPSRNPAWGTLDGTPPLGGVTPQVGFGAMHITPLSGILNALPLPEAGVLQKPGGVTCLAAGGQPLGRPGLPDCLITVSFPTHRLEAICFRNVTYDLWL